jgi:hypothetical protein
VAGADLATASQMLERSSVALTVHRFFRTRRTSGPEHHRALPD